MKNFLLKYDVPLVALLGMVLFIPFLGSVHLFDWDEVNFAESAREMLLSGNYQKVQINFMPFMEKPPLFFWLQAASMKVFGVNEFAARFPNALIGVVTLALVYKIGKRWFSPQFAFFWVLFITGSLTPHLYFKTGIIDPLYNLFIFSAIYQLFLYVRTKAVAHAWFIGLFVGLAIITKGPVAVVVLVLCFLVYWVLNHFKKFFLWTHLFYATFAAFMGSALWFGFETIENGPGFLIEFIKYQADLFLHPVAGHGQPFWYHPVVLLLGCFPASIFALPILFKRKLSLENEAQQILVNMMQLFFWVVLILFSIVETKIVHYSSLCYLPLTFMATYYLHTWSSAKLFFSWTQGILFAFIGLLLSIIFVILPQTDNLKHYFIPFIKDSFAVASLSVSGNWLGYESLLGILFFVVLCYVILLFIRKQVNYGTFLFLAFTSVFIPALLLFVAPRIEKYSQGPAIEFFESLQGKDVYIETLGYKSYAQYYYGRTNAHENINATDLHWLQTGKLDKDAYFSLHVNNVNDHINASMHEVGRKGGFVFFKRNANDNLLENIVKP